MQRRKFICSCVGGMFSSLAGTAHAQWTDKAVGSNDAPTTPATSAMGNDPDATTAKHKSMRKGLTGCYLNATNEETRQQYKLMGSTGWPALDIGLTHEYGVLCQSFGSTPGFFMYNDSSGPNAFATPERIGGHTQAHGTVCFGVSLMRNEFQSAGGGRGDHVMVAIMAHEWAHILQFRKLSQLVPGKPMELQADFMSGWYMGTRSQHVAGVDVMSSMRSMFSKGDYEYNSPGHHGTPQERAAAFQNGLLASMHGMNTSQAFQASATENGLS